MTIIRAYAYFLRTREVGVKSARMDQTPMLLQHWRPRNDSTVEILEFKSSNNDRNPGKSPTNTGTITCEEHRHELFLSSIEQDENSSNVKSTCTDGYVEGKIASSHHSTNQIFDDRRHSSSKKQPQQGLINNNSKNKSNSDFGFFCSDLDTDETEEEINYTIMRLPDASLCEKDSMEKESITTKPYELDSSNAVAPLQKKFARSLSVPEDCIISGIPSITDLDRIQREKRENAEKKDAFESENHINVAIRTARAYLDDDGLTMMDSDNSLSNNSRCGPRLRIRPQPMQTMLMHHRNNNKARDMSSSSPVIIPKGNMLHTNHVDSSVNSFSNLFPSPDSDRFVLHFPEQTTVTNSDYNSNDNSTSDQLEEQTWSISNHALMPDNLRLIDQMEDDDHSPFTSLSHHQQANNVNNQYRDEANSSTASRSPLSTGGSPSKRNILSTKPEVIRKKPIRLKPKIPSKQLDLTRKKSASSLSSSSSSEDLDLPIHYKLDNHHHVEIIHPKPIRTTLANQMYGDTTSSTTTSHNVMKKGKTTVPFSLPLSNTALRSNTNGIYHTTQFHMSMDPLEDLAVPNFDSSDVSPSSTSRTINHPNDCPITSLDTNLLEQRFFSNISITNHQDLTTTNEDDYRQLRSNHNDNHHSKNMYASPQDTDDQEHMSSPPQMEPKKIQNQLLRAKQAALRFSSSRNNHCHDRSISIGSLDPVSPPISHDCYYTTPQSKMEKPDFYGEGKGDRTSNRKNLFLPRLSSFSGKSEGIFEMEMDQLNTSTKTKGFLQNNHLSATKISEF